jgi:hypothetical protein
MNKAATNKRTSAGAGWVNILFGLWVGVSPFVLGFSRNTAAMWNNFAVGVGIVFLAVASEWGNGLVPVLIVRLGAWLFWSPFVLGFSSAAFLGNNILMSFVVISVAASSEYLRSTDAPGISPRS